MCYHHYYFCCFVVVVVVIPICSRSNGSSSSGVCVGSGRSSSGCSSSINTHLLFVSTACYSFAATITIMSRFAYLVGT